MKLYLSLTKMDDKILIILRHSTANTVFNEGKTIKQLIDISEVKDLLIKVFKMTEKQLKLTNYSRVNIKYNGNPEFHYLLADIFWFNLKDVSFVYKNRNSIITFINKNVSLTMIKFNILEYFKLK